ncbi:dinuclear metal center protein, YbgI/SA1388 family [bacterium A37T11]|nr:dinuclear metal center protein, YbgI/SA1388 family [bacterium A37T11]
MVINDIIQLLEQLAPPAYQESYDNSGLLVGHPTTVIDKAIISLDCTEEVVDEAIHSGCGLIISHHPILFKGLKRLNGTTYIERAIIKAIKHDVAIYAIHTNLDNVLGGVNSQIAKRLGLINTSILAPRGEALYKLVVFAPQNQAEAIRTALFNAGCGNIGNYSECSFSGLGEGTFKGGIGTHPFVGEPGYVHLEHEIRIETVFPMHLKSQVVQALLKAHPYEEVAYDIYPLQNEWPQVGSGLLGELEVPCSAAEFLAQLKEKLQVTVIRHTALKEGQVKKVAVCGGAGGFLLPVAKGVNADFFVTADFKYHEFFDAEGKIVIADIGHFESEQFTQELLLETIQKKFPNFAIRLTGVNTNPIKYYI